MARIVFWDTVAFVALGNRDDALHNHAVAINGELAGEKALILTTDAVLTEVVTTFSKVALRPIAQRLIEAFRQSATLGAAQMIHVDEPLWQRGWQLFRERADKDWGIDRLHKLCRGARTAIHRRIYF